ALAADVYVAGAFHQRSDVAITFTAERTVGVAIAPGVPRGPASAAPGARIFGRHAISCSGVGPNRSMVGGVGLSIGQGPSYPATVASRPIRPVHPDNHPQIW